jgi:GNAT superfamily N-acetyltransferase
MDVRRVRLDPDLTAYVDVWNAVTPDEPTEAALQRERLERDPRRCYLLADHGGAVAGCAFAGPSDSPGRGFVSPRVLPVARRRGLGTALLEGAVLHLESLGFESVSAHVDGTDDASLAFAARFGFEEVDRQVEQARAVGDERAPALPDGLEVVSIAERPELLERAYAAVAVDAYADLPLAFQIEVTLEEWLREEATLRDGSFVALEGEDVVGYAGLMRHAGGDGIAEHGLTAVRRDRRGGGIGTLLKRTQLAWASRSGVRELVTWTQRGNENMQRVNERLGYVIRTESVTVRAPLPLPS